jgi:hypothetical protein
MIRAFCEVVIVGQRDRNPTDVKAIASARDVTYALFSLLFVGFILSALHQFPQTNGLLETDRHVHEIVTNTVLEKIPRLTGGYRSTGPTIAKLFEEVEHDANLKEPAFPEDQPAVKREVDELRLYYADWTPIERQPIDFQRINVEAAIEESGEEDLGVDRNAGSIV